MLQSLTRVETKFMKNLIAFVLLAAFLHESLAATCRYSVTFFGLYMCELEVSILLGDEEFTIGGTHLDGISDDDVALLIVTGTKLEVFSNVITEKFKNLEHVWIRVVGLERISVLTNCDSLEQLDISQNLLTTLPESIFANCRKMTDLSIFGNNLTAIDYRAFHDASVLETFGPAV